MISHRYTLSLLSLLSLWFGMASCSHEPQVTSELGKPLYEIKDSDDPLDHLIYTIHQETGIQIIYDFDPLSAQWNLGQSSGLLNSARYVPYSPDDIGSRKSILGTVQKLNDEFLSLYPKEFKQSYFPLRIFVCDSIISKKKEVPVFSGRDHLAINVPPSDLAAEKVPDYYSTLWQGSHQKLWNYIFTYRLTPPANFLSYSGDKYNENLGEVKDPNYDIRMDGFWTYNKLLTFKFYKAIDMATDISDYMLKMVTYPREEVFEQMGGYDIMASKYLILHSFILEETGLDLQQIGNRNK